MKAAMFMLIPNNPHLNIVNLSSFSIGLDLKNKLRNQNIKVAPKTRSSTNPSDLYNVALLALLLYD